MEISSKLNISAKDYVDILDVYSRYAWYLNTGDYYAALGVFGGQKWMWDPPYGKMDGDDGIQFFFRTLISRPTWKHKQHIVWQKVISGGPEKCECFAHWICGDLEGDDMVVRKRGFYNDCCVKIHGKWFFESRHIEYWLFNNEDAQ